MNLVLYKFKVRFSLRILSLANQQSRREHLTQKGRIVPFFGIRNSTLFPPRYSGCSTFLSRFSSYFLVFHAFCRVQWLKNAVITCLRRDFPVPENISNRELRTIYQIHLKSHGGKRQQQKPCPPTPGIRKVECGIRNEKTMSYETSGF